MSAGDFAGAGVLVLADSAAGRGRAEAAVRAAGLRLLGCEDIAGAVAAIEARATIAVVLLDAQGPVTPALVALIARLGSDVAPYASVLHLARPLIDLAWSLAPAAALLVDAGEGDIATTLTEATASPRPASVAEHGGDTAPLRRLSEEVGRIARTLAALSETGPDFHAPPVALPASGLTVGKIRAVIRARRLRERFLDPALFADPAWDMLLDLMAARLEGRPVAVSSLCIAGAVPTTTALRWIRVMTDAGLFTRVPDSEDGRRFFVGLADDIASALAAYFAELERQGLPGA